MLKSCNVYIGVSQRDIINNDLPSNSGGVFILLYFVPNNLYFALVAGVF